LNIFPKLRVVMIEGGFGWAPSLAWRLDAHWAKMRNETPHVKMKPSEYMRRNVWFSTQPVEEPENPDDLRKICEWIGWDRLLYASDYPHWDFDAPVRAFPIVMSEQEKRMLFHDNAVAFYQLKACSAIGDGGGPRPRPRQRREPHVIRHRYAVAERARHREAEPCVRRGDARAAAGAGARDLRDGGIGQASNSPSTRTPQHGEGRRLYLDTM
jgi:Amidohydrolase